MQYSLQTLFDLKNVSFGLFRIYKGIYQKLSVKKTDQKSILLILGCQRSGTSLMYWIFERDFDTKIYRESSELSSNDVNKIRLNPLVSVQVAIDKHKVPLVVLKPLVESQRALMLLENLKGAKVLWMYRHYKDVASSNLKAFGIKNGINDLRPIVEKKPDNWRSEHISEYTRSIVLEHFSEDMNPYDAAALFWFVRNRLFFELNLDNNINVMLCRYEDLVAHPADVMQTVYKFVGCAYPGDQIDRDVHRQSIGKGDTTKLSPEIEKVCAELLAGLNRVCFN